MVAALRSFLYSFVAFSLTLLLSSCGGGGGGATTDPAAVYNGKTSQAVLTQGNVEAMALEGFSGGNIGSTVGTPKLASTNKIVTPPFRGLVAVLRNSVLPIDPSLMVQRGSSSASGKSVARRLNQQVAGDDGGWAYYSLDVNDATGTFSGSIAFNGFSSGGVAVTGHATVTGREDGEDVTALSLAFDSLSVGVGESVITMVGTTSWQFDAAGSSDVMTMNIAFVDRPHVYWCRNYVIATTYGAYALTQTISGRYYNSDYGFVDFHTVTPISADYEAEYPFLGVLQLDGGAGTSARLNFQSGSLQLQADLDGNNSMEWQKVFQTGTLYSPTDAGQLP